MATSPDTPIPTAERLQEIRDADTALGDELRWYSIAYTHRRELLAYIDMQVQTMLSVSREAEKIQQHLVGVYNWQEQQGAPIPTAIRSTVYAAGPVDDDACCSNESRNMNGGCDSCGDPCL